MNSRLLLSAFCIAVVASGARASLALPVQDAAPAYTPEQQQQTAPPAQPSPSQTVQGSQVPNEPAYRQQKTAPKKVQQTTPPQPEAPTPNQQLTNGPPAEQPLPPAPPLPPPAPPAYAQNEQIHAMPPYHPGASEYVASAYGSTYIPLDSWMNQAVLRLYSLGFVDSAFIGFRPWTRQSVLHMLSRCAEKIDTEEPDDSEARRIYEALREELEYVAPATLGQRPGEFDVESVYTRMMVIGGTPLRDSFHAGSTIINDYGRPYGQGFNNVTGFSTRAQQGRFSFYLRGEYQHAPTYTGYDPAQVAILAHLDELTSGQLPTISLPAGIQPSQNNIRILETDVAAHFFGTEFSFGKHDEWLGPAYGGAFAWSNNAEPIYSFKFNRVEPLYIPYLSHFLGPLRYEFFVGSLKGHTAPNDPWTHLEKFSFKPTGNFEFGFSRTVIWGGLGHESITLKSFFRSFFSITDTSANQKNCFGVLPSQCTDPGARFSQFDFSYRVPFLRKYLTFYTDSEVHDDVTPASAPRRAAFRPGLYLAKLPGAPRLDFRVEAVSTDPDTGRSISGSFMYWETVQRNGYTNKGQIMGDWIGREAKGGQAWLTYHLSPSEMLQFNYRNAKGAKDFVPGGTTQNDFTGNVVKRLGKDVEVNAWVQVERLNVPFIRPGTQSNTTGAAQITWFPKFSKQD